MLLFYLASLAIAYTAVHLEKRTIIAQSTHKKTLDVVVDIPSRHDADQGITAKIIDEGMESAMREASAGIEVVGGQLQVNGSKVKAFSITINIHNGNTEE